MAEHVSRYYQLFPWLCSKCYGHWLRRRQLPLFLKTALFKYTVGLDITLAACGNRYAIVFQDMFTKWPMVILPLIKHYKASDPAYGANVWNPRGTANRSRKQSAILSYARCMQATWNEKDKYYCTPSAVQQDGRAVQSKS